MNDTILLNNGMEILIQNLGLLQTERFVFLMNQENFDYTRWQQEMYQGMSAKEISAMASERQEQTAAT